MHLVLDCARAHLMHLFLDLFIAHLILLLLLDCAYLTYLMHLLFYFPHHLNLRLVIAHLMHLLFDFAYLANN